jgi:hypothetical protein
VLAALYNNSQPLGMGFLHYTPEDMTVEEAAEILECHLSFDYLKGRVMKINLYGTSFNSHLYNRDNGENAAENVILKLKNKSA